MFQETATWDLRYINREPSMSMKLYILFLLFCCIVTSVELFKAWRVAPPFKLSPSQQPFVRQNARGFEDAA